ncbi:MAG: short chain dehydrogenase [Dehalococcoidia bacterium]|nr:short chain dehydrogenase [Dehalococcoidia bacterium]
MVGQYDGKVALVTGGSSGIGRATALAFAREGARVVIADVDATGGAETVRMIEEAGREALFTQTDVSRAPEVEAMVGTAVETYGRLDCAFNNAGVGSGAPLHEYPEELWDRIIGINLKGVWLCLKYEIAHMRQHGGGAIVNTSSVLGLVGQGVVGTPGGSAYAASKHGVLGLTKSAALDYGPEGIRVNAVCPAITTTPPAERIFAENPGLEEQAVARVPLGRTGRPDDPAEAVVWLCSDAASFVTGHALAIDGGFVAG